MGKKQAASPIRSLAKAVVPSGVRAGGRRKRRIAAQVKQGAAAHLGFLHIPKTGGSGVQELGRRLAERGLPHAVGFGHAWTLAAVRQQFPEMRVALILRDPLERTISGFNSRLRQGRPTYHRPWRPAEAAAFALFPDVRRFLDALVADDDWSLSAVAYAAKHVTHLRWNYRFYFKSPAAVKKNAEAIALVGRIEDTGAFLDALLAEAGTSPEAAAGLYERRHAAPAGSAGALAGYGEAEVAKMRARLADEYAIHDALLALGRAPRAAGAASAA